ncbi:glycosyltransferase family 4 protein [Devosia sp.]|uniref:glycosyltransferase family 4 protein n=1 Tax=Devosia sp. TaxID=1871048 RepID=UPI003A8FB317
MLHKVDIDKVDIDTKLDVLVTMPTGANGQGGIDRIMATLGNAVKTEDRPGLTVRFSATRGPGHIITSPFYLARFMLLMVWLRLTGRLDLLHINLSSHGSTYRKLIIAAFARVLRVPYVLHLHGGNYREFWADSAPLMSRAILSMFNHAAGIVVLGSVWRGFVANRAPAAADRITVVPNAAPQPSLQPDRGDAVHILYLGRLSDMKGVPQLGEALAALKDVPGWRATLAGDGGVEEARHAAQNYDIADRVAIPGWVDSDTVAQLVASADILVLPSFVENLPVSIIEGMAAGLAVVATPVGAVEDIVINNETGLLVETGNVKELTQALHRLIGDSALRQRLGTAARSFHRAHLDVKPFADAMINTWKQARDVKTN